MKMKASAITAAALLALAAQAAHAAEAVGYNTLTVPANSDVLVSVPFNNNVEATYTVNTAIGTGITVNEALSAGTYNSSYYIRVIDGAGEGLWSTISANGDGGLTIADDLSGYIANGDTFRVYEHQTVASVFPAGMKGVSFDANTRLLVYEGASAGINKAQKVTLQYAVALPAFNGWNNGVPFSNFNQQVLTPGSHIRVRNGSPSNLTFIAMGDVPDCSNSMILKGNTADDVIASTGFPVPVAMSESGLNGTGTVLLFNNSAPGQNKAQSLTLSYAIAPPAFNGWNNGVPFSNYNSQKINSSEGFIVRRNSSSSQVKVTIPKPY